MGAASSCPVVIPTEDDFDADGVLLLEKIDRRSHKRTKQQKKQKQQQKQQQQQKREESNRVKRIVHELENDRDAVSIVFFDEGDEEDDDDDDFDASSHPQCFALPLFDAISSHLSTLAEATKGAQRHQRSQNSNEDGLPSLVRSSSNSVADGDEGEELEADLELLRLELREAQSGFRRLTNKEGTEEEEPPASEFEATLLEEFARAEANKKESGAGEDGEDANGAARDTEAKDDATEPEPMRADAIVSITGAEEDNINIQRLKQEGLLNEAEFDSFLLDLQETLDGHQSLDTDKDRHDTDYDKEDEDEDPDLDLDSLRLALQNIDKTPEKAFDSLMLELRGTETHSGSLEQGDEDPDREEDPHADLDALRLELEQFDANHEFFELEATVTAEEQQQPSSKEREAEDEHQDTDLDSLRMELLDDEDAFRRRDAADLIASSQTTGRNTGSNSSDDDDTKHRNSSSFIDLQQLLFASAGNDDGGGDHDDANTRDSSSNAPTTGSSSSSSSSILLYSSTRLPDHCKVVVDIYETHSTQLKPRSPSEREDVPLEKAGIPFRKCRDPVCACNGPKPPQPVSPGPSRTSGGSPATKRDESTLHRRTTTSLATTKDDEDCSPVSFRSRRQERKRALRVRNQRNNQLASDYDEREHDDFTATTAENSDSTRSASSWTSHVGGFGQPQESPTGPSPVHRDVRGAPNPYRPRHQRARSEDYVEKGTYATLSGGNRVAVPATSAGAPPRLPSRLPRRGSGSENSPSQRQKNVHPPLLPRTESRDRGNDRGGIEKEAREDVPDDAFQTHRRFRSEDLVDANRPESSSSSLELSRQRSYSEHVTTSPKIPIDLGDKHCDGGRDENSSALSPVSVVEEIRRDSRSSSQRRSPKEPRTTPVKKRKTKKQRKKPSRQTPPKCYGERERALSNCRRSIRVLNHNEKSERRNRNRQLGAAASVREVQLQRRKRFEHALQLTFLYHKMGLLHYQQGRYDTARHVLEHGLEILIADRANTIVPPVAAAASAVRTKANGGTRASEEDAMFDADYSDTLESASDSSLYAPGSALESLPPLPTLDEVAPYFSNQALLLAAELVLARGKVFAAQGLWSDAKRTTGRILQWSAFQRQRMILAQQAQEQSQFNYHYVYYPNHEQLEYWREWGPITARAQVLFAECFQRENHLDLAMAYYQEALTVQRNVLGPRHVQVAETVYRIGNVHASRGFLELAELCYHEALGVYRHHREETGSTPDSGQDSNASILADEATVLASLGWVFLLRREGDKAYRTTNEALRSTIHALGPSHRNVASLQHQMSCIHNLYR